MSKLIAVVTPVLVWGSASHSRLPLVWAPVITTSSTSTSRLPATSVRLSSIKIVLPGVVTSLLSSSSFTTSASTSAFLLSSSLWGYMGLKRFLLLSINSPIIHEEEFIFNGSKRIGCSSTSCGSGGFCCGINCFGLMCLHLVTTLSSSWMS